MDIPIPRRDGGTGRRSGLKIRRSQGRGGSTPPPGTKSKAPYPAYFQMLTAFDNATCFGCLGLASAARYKFRYSAHPLSFLYFAFVRGRLCFGWFSPFTPDFGMRGGLVQFKSGCVRRFECAWSSIDDNGPLHVFRVGHPRNTLMAIQHETKQKGSNIPAYRPQFRDLERTSKQHFDWVDPCSPREPIAPSAFNLNQ